MLMYMQKKTLPRIINNISKYKKQIYVTIEKNGNITPSLLLDSIIKNPLVKIIKENDTIGLNTTHERKRYGAVKLFWYMKKNIIKINSTCSDVSKKLLLKELLNVVYDGNNYHGKGRNKKENDDGFMSLVILIYTLKYVKDKIPFIKMYMNQWENTSILNRDFM